MPGTVLHSEGEAARYSMRGTIGKTPRFMLTVCEANIWGWGQK